MAKAIQGGVFAAAVTPRKELECSVDLAATLELIDFLSDRGVDGIALLTPTGEFPHFAIEDRAHMLDFAVRRSRLPILANVAHSTWDGALYLGEAAAASGVAGVLLMPPYHYRYDQETLRAFLMQFADAVAKDVPVYLYNAPDFTNGLSEESAAELLRSAGFGGIVDAAEHRRYPGFTVFTARDRSYRSDRVNGASGCVSDVAGAAPELMARLEKAILAGDAALADRLSARVGEFLDWTERLPAPVGIKEAVRLRKIKTGALASPLGDEARRQRDAFLTWFQEWLPAVLKECR